MLKRVASTMPRVASADGGSHRSHAFPGGHDEELVRSALDIRAQRRAAGRVEVVLTPRDVTHAVPTGDLFRRIMVTAEVAHGPRAVRYLARHHERNAHEQRVETSDDRPHAGPQRLTLELGPAAPATAPIVVRVSYQRVDHLVGDDEARARVSGEILLAEQALPGLAAPPPAPLVTPPPVRPHRARSWLWLGGSLIALGISVSVHGRRRARRGHARPR